jgi:hypothetical protein
MSCGRGAILEEETKEGVTGLLSQQEARRSEQGGGCRCDQGEDSGCVWRTQSSVRGTGVGGTCLMSSAGVSGGHQLVFWTRAGRVVLVTTQEQSQKGRDGMHHLR